MATWRDLSRAPDPREFTLRISPKGVEERSLSPASYVQNIIAGAGRIRYIVRAEAKTKVFDKALGQLWLLIEPVIMAALYFFITTVVFTFGGEERQFLFILTAVIFWRWFSRTVDGAPLAIVSYAAILKQSRFSPIMVVWSYMATEFFFFLMSCIVLVAFLAFYGCYPNINYLYLPLPLAAQFSIMVFLTIVFAAIGTFIKDLAGILYAVTSIWWYLSPGIYPVSKIPAEYLWIYKLNPFAYILPAYRDILIDGAAPSTVPLIFLIVGFCVLSLLALKVFDRVRYYFFTFL